jgi:hypothetical protein
MERIVPIWQKEPKHPMGLTLPVRVGFSPVTGRERCALVFLVLDLDILPGTEVSQYLNQQADSQTCF